jgi:hypothetical protein
MIPLLLDRFEIEGLNGTHPYYVTTPVRVNLSESKDRSYNHLFQLEAARALAAQLVIVVNYDCSSGFVHRNLRCLKSYSRCRLI